MTSFSDFQLNKQLIAATEDMGYFEPTPIQEKAIPRILNGHDIIGIAQTGTGKTAAYVLPLLMKLKYAQGEDPRGLIIAPTRELVLQVYETILELGKNTDLRTVCLYGGIGPKKQAEEVESGCDLIVATPGRFLDIYNRISFNPKLIKTFVLDEADRMMDMGFMPQIRNILELLPMKKQNLFFSATFPEQVEKYAYEFTDFPEKIEVAPQSSTTELIKQYAYPVPNFLTKINLLSHLLKQDEFTKVLIFVRTRKTANNVFSFVERKISSDARVIHANKAQSTRINAINAFKAGEIKILVSTDVSARGIDASEVSHVINFEVPTKYEEYVHRIGRTGRAMQEGIAISFVDEPDEFHLQKIEELIKQKVERLLLPSEVEIMEMLPQEKKDFALEIDRQKRMSDPTYKGAFQEKKLKNQKENGKTYLKRKKSDRRRKK
jgi:ATP-dependent RNA helicase RhlE